MPGLAYVKTILEATAKAQNAEFFASDLLPDIDTGKAADFVIDIQVSTTAATLQVTYDSGATWRNLVATTQAVGVLVRYRVSVHQGELFNMRASNASGTTVDRCSVVMDLDQ